MVAKYWKKIGLVILIIACIFNVMNKLIKSTNLVEELKASASYVLSQEKTDSENK